MYDQKLIVKATITDALTPKGGAHTSHRGPPSSWTTILKTDSQRVLPDRLCTISGDFWLGYPGSLSCSASWSGDHLTACLASGSSGVEICVDYSRGTANIKPLIVYVSLPHHCLFEMLC